MLKTTPLSDYDPNIHGPIAGIENVDFPVDDAIGLVSELDKTVGTEAAIRTLNHLKESGRDTIFIGFYSVEGRAKILIA